MNNLTLKQLRYFNALAQTGHFGNAAAISAVSQPALSVQIKDLEESLGLPLFERSTRRVRLTSFGREFHAKVKEILRSVDDLGTLARVSQGGVVGQLRLGVIPTIAPYLLPRIVSYLTEENAQIDMKIRETVTPTLLAELIDGRLDAAIVALPISEPDLQEFPLFEEEFVLIRPQQESGLPTPAREQLREMKLLLLEEGHCFRDQALAFCGAGANTPRELLDASSLSTLVQLVSSGVGVTLIPEMALPVETGSAKVSVSRFDAPLPRRTVGMIWRRSSSMRGQLEDLAQKLRTVLADE